MSAASPFARESRREQQRQRTRARLFDAALDEFRRAGFDRASVARIARRADVSRSSFYFHFPTREHVLLELQWKLELALVARIEPCTTPGEALAELAQGLVDAEASVGCPRLFRDMLAIYARRPDSVPLDEQPFPLVHAVGGRFAQAATRGELRGGLDPARATHLFLSSVFGYLMGTPAPPAERRDDLQALVSLYLSGSGS